VGLGVNQLTKQTNKLPASKGAGFLLHQSADQIYKYTSIFLCNMVLTEKIC